MCSLKILNKVQDALLYVCNLQNKHLVFHFLLTVGLASLRWNILLVFVFNVIKF